RRQGGQCGVVGAGSVQCRGGLAGLLGGQVRGAGDEGADPLVQGVGAGAGVLEDLGRGHLAAADRGGQLPGGQVVQLSHTSSLSPGSGLLPRYRSLRRAGRRALGRAGETWSTGRTTRSRRSVLTSLDPPPVLAAGIPPDGADDG